MNYPNIDYITEPEVNVVSVDNMREDSHFDENLRLLIRVTRPAASILYALFNGRNGTTLYDLEQDDLVFMVPELEEPQSNATKQLAIDEMGTSYEEAFATYNYLLDLGVSNQQAELVLPNGLTVPLLMQIPAIAFRNFVKMNIPFWNKELKQVCAQFETIYAKLFTEEAA